MMRYYCSFILLRLIFKGVNATESHKKIPELLIKKLMQIYLQYISSNTSTCFGHIYNPCISCTSWWWAVDTPGTCRGVWRNIPKIKCASIWFFFKWIYRDARSTKHKTWNYCWSWNVKQTKLSFMRNNFTDTTGLWQCKLASKPDVLFYSALDLLPVGGVQFVQRTEGNSTIKHCVNSSAE